MIARYRNTIIITNLVLVLAFFAWSVEQKESTLKNGQLVLLELAPVDPRSLMQGDYMSLNYKIATWRADSIPENGFFVLQLDGHHVGTLLRMQRDKHPVNEGEIIIKYKSWGNRIGAESYFFEEGQAEKYENARYGGLRVDTHGNSILVGLYGEDFMQIK